MAEDLERGAAALKAELLSSIDRWRGSLPSEDQGGNTLTLGIADRAITLTSALVHEVTQTLMRDEPLRDRATLGEHIGLIQRVGRKRHTSCLATAGPLVSKSDSRTLDRFAALRNELAHPEGEGFDVATLGRCRPSRVAEILDVAASIANMTIVDETICHQAATDAVRPGGASRLTETTATLFVNDDHSRCGACGRDADPAEPAHITLLWTLEKRAGCGARFVALASDLPMTPRLRASLIDMRPDLPILGEPVN